MLDKLSKIDKYVGPYCPAEMYAGRVACCPLVSHGEYADGTDTRRDRRTDGQRHKCMRNQNCTDGKRNSRNCVTKIAVFDVFCRRNLLYTI